MNLSLQFRDQLAAEAPYLVDELDQLIAAIKGSWNVQHNADDSHAHVSAFDLTLAQNATTGATGNIDSAGGRIRMTGTADSRVGGDFYTNFGLDALSVVNGRLDGEASLRSYGNASVFGPALILGPDSASAKYQWDIVADTLPGTGSSPRLAFVPSKDGNLYRFAAAIAQSDLAAVAGEYFIVPSVPGTLNIGAPSGKFPGYSGPAAVNAVYVKNGMFEGFRTTAAGYWQARTYAAGNFTTNGATWAVSAVNVSADRYALIGKTMHWHIELDSTIVSGAGSTELRVTLPGGAVANSRQMWIGRSQDGGAAFTPTIALAVGGDTFVRFYNAVNSPTNWSVAGGANTGLSFTLAGLEIT